ncbi:MAG: hypothetical protein O7G88_20975 [bacterium]|nr:hypothetical protein [bacterium]
MNTTAPDSSRRRFLTRLFTAPDAALARTELTTIPELRQQTDGVLWAVAGDAPDNLFVAGDDGVVFHFDGEHWQRENLGSKLHVHALCIRGDEVYSVGWLGRICVRENGQWQPMQGGQNEASTVNQPLFDCEAASDGSLWAVGDHGRITQYDGDQWIEHSSGSTANLRAVLPLADGRILASGLGGTVLELSDGQWRQIETNTGCPIVSMAPLSDGAVIAVGGEYSTESQQFIGRIFLYTGDDWSAVEVDYPLPRLRRIRREGSNLLITGDGGTAFRWTADGVSQLATRLRYDLHDVISFADGQALICGDDGTVLQEAPLEEQSGQVITSSRARWQQISNGETNKTLRTLWAIDAEHVIAAGDSGTVVHLSDGQITVTETPGKQRIHALWGSSPRNIFAVCDAATILHFDGKEWSVAHQGGVDTALLAITGFGPHDIFAVGDSGYALRYDGLMWRKIETGIKQELYGLWGQDSQHLLAVGGGGVILRWNGERWKSFGAGTDQDLYGVHGSSLNKLFIAGLAGTLIRFEDNSWHREFSGVRSDLHAVAGNNHEFFVVGSNGTILRNSDGIWEPEDSDCDNTLQAVAATENGIFAVGSGGLFLRRRLP